MTEIFLQRRRQEEIEPLPAEESRGRDHRVLDQQTEREEDGAVADHGEQRDAEVGRRLAERRGRESR